MSGEEGKRLLLVTRGWIIKREEIKEKKEIDIKDIIDRDIVK